MTPEIIFQRAAPHYEANLRKLPDYTMPADSVYEEKIEALKNFWSEWGQKIFDQLAQITGIEWQEKDIRCYIVSGTKSSFSHPLTLKIYDTDEQMHDTFTHELIHRLLNIRNTPQHIADARKKFMEHYAQESIVTKNHIILHAIHAELAFTLFGMERQQRIMHSAKTPDYIRAWDIVQEQGREVILKDVFGYSKSV